ncbi:MAG: transcription repressor NadR [Clostridia bacterium]|nr:transcription repressor NadR [Clostridia bacterium]
MNGEERRAQLIKILSESDCPVSGTVLARKLQVTRQAIVQDVALLRANGEQIFSASRGYVLIGKNECERIFKTIHSDEDVEQELTLIIDLGGKVKDEFVYHKAYGVVKADMNIRSRKDIAEFLHNINTGKSKPLKNVTSGYHYHTVTADDVQTLNEIEKCLRDRGFLAKLNEYEPVDFRKNDKQ